MDLHDSILKHNDLFFTGIDVGNYMNQIVAKQKGNFLLLLSLSTSISDKLFQIFILFTSIDMKISNESNA